MSVPLFVPPAARKLARRLSFRGEIVIAPVTRSSWPAAVGAAWDPSGQCRRVRLPVFDTGIGPMGEVATGSLG